MFTTQAVAVEVIWENRRTSRSVAQGCLRRRHHTTTPDTNANGMSVSCLSEPADVCSAVMNGAMVVPRGGGGVVGSGSSPVVGAGVGGNCRPGGVAVWGKSPPVVAQVWAV